MRVVTHYAADPPSPFRYLGDVERMKRAVIGHDLYLIGRRGLLGCFPTGAAGCHVVVTGEQHEDGSRHIPGPHRPTERVVDDRARKTQLRVLVLRQSHENRASPIRPPQGTDALLVDGWLRSQPGHGIDEILGGILFAHHRCSNAVLEAAATNVIHEHDDVALCAKLLGHAFVELPRAHRREAATTRHEGYGGVRARAGRPEDTVAVFESLREARRRPEHQHTEGPNDAHRGRASLGPHGLSTAARSARSESRSDWPLA